MTPTPTGPKNPSFNIDDVNTIGFTGTHRDVNVLDHMIETAENRDIEIQHSYWDYDFLAPFRRRTRQKLADWLRHYRLAFDEDAAMPAVEPATTPEPDEWADADNLNMHGVAIGELTERVAKLEDDLREIESGGDQILQNHLRRLDAHDAALAELVARDNGFQAQLNHHRQLIDALAERLETP